MHSARSSLIRDSCLLDPGRKRQRLPVQLWGQLQRPCRVLGAATDSWSLQRRCSAAMARCGRARLAAGAPRSSRRLALAGSIGCEDGLNAVVPAAEHHGPLRQTLCRRFGRERAAGPEHHRQHCAVIHLDRGRDWSMSTV